MFEKPGYLSAFKLYHIKSPHRLLPFSKLYAFRNNTKYFTIFYRRFSTVYKLSVGKRYKRRDNSRSRKNYNEKNLFRVCSRRVTAPIKRYYRNFESKICRYPLSVATKISRFINHNRCT